MALVNASTAYQQGALASSQAEFIFLGIAGIYKLALEEQKKYYEETVEMVNAKYLVPVHWDDFMNSKAGDLLPMKRKMGDFGKEMDVIIELNENSKNSTDIILLKRHDSIYIEREY